MVEGREQEKHASTFLYVQWRAKRVHRQKPGFDRDKNNDDKVHEEVWEISVGGNSEQ